MGKSVENGIARQGRVGKGLASAGLALICTSTILVFLAVSGATLHSVLQLGGIAGVVVGLSLWKGLNI